MRSVIWRIVAVVAVVLVGGGGIAWLAHSSSGAGSGGSASSGSMAVGADEGAVAPGNVAPSNSAQGSGADGTGAAPADVVAPRDIVRTAQLTVTADDPTAAAAKADTIATTAGGRVDQDDRSDSAHLVLRVPASALDATLDRLAGLGRETGRQVSGQDVTAQTADLDARVQALQTSVTRLQQLISTSGSLDDLLQVETQLTQRQADLESLQAQQRAMADQVSLATITLDLVAPAAAAKAGGAPTGFGAAVVSGWHGFVLAVRYVVAGLGYSLPVLVLLAVVTVAVVWVRRRRRPVDGLPSEG